MNTEDRIINNLAALLREAYARPTLTEWAEGIADAYQCACRTAGREYCLLPGV